MIFDNNSNQKCFREMSEIDDVQLQPIETDVASPSSLPDLNAMSPPSPRRQSPESPSSRAEEESVKKILKCDYCDKTFTLANVLKVHQRIHTGEKPYVCEICGKAFNQSGSLNRHRNTHRYRDATDNNFICRFCNAKFPHGSLLETHEKSAHHNRRSGRPRNLSSIDNSATSVDGKVGDCFSKFNFVAQNDLKHDKLSPLTNENGDGNIDSPGIIKDHNKPMGGNGEYNFTCPYCQLGVNDLRELGIHLSHHNLSNGLNSGAPAMTSPTNQMLSKANTIFSPETLVQQLTSLSKKLKIPPTSEFNPNLGSIGSMAPNSSFLPLSFDRLRPTDTIPNMSFHLPNTVGNVANQQNHQVPPDSYNLAAFVLATLSKDYLYKHRNQAPPSQPDNPFPLPTSEFLKSHMFHHKSPLLGPNSADFYNLFNVPKALNNLQCSIDTGSNHNIESDPPLEMSDNASYNVNHVTNVSPNSNFLSRPHRTESAVVNSNRKPSHPRSSPASSGRTTQTSSNKTTDIFFSRKNGGERRKCPDCDKQFTCESALRIHYRKHSGERPYACEFCSKTFSQNGTLKRHHLTCKNRPSITSTKKSSMSQDPDSTQEVNNSSTASNYVLTRSPAYPVNHPLSYPLNTNFSETGTNFDRFPNKETFQPVSSYSSGEVSRKTSERRSPYNNIGSSEEPTDLTINGSRNEETVSQSIDEETHLDIDSVDDKHFMLKIEDSNNNEDMEITETKLTIPTNCCEQNSLEYRFNCEDNIIYNFSTKEILAHLVDNGRLMVCCHCLIYFETEKTYSVHIQTHYNHNSSLECNDCNFVAKDEVAFKEHFNDLGVLSRIKR